MTKEEIAAQLDRAADYLEKYGWTQGEFAEPGDDPDDDPNDPVETTGVAHFFSKPACALGAITLANLDQVGSSTWCGEANSPAARALNIHLSRTMDWEDDVIDWNDCYADTADEVITAMRQTAKKLVSEEIVL